MQLKHILYFLGFSVVILSENLALADSMIDKNTKIEVLGFNGEQYFEESINETTAWAAQETLDQTLPESFTICSATARYPESNCQVFFTILEDNDSHYLSALAWSDQVSSSLYYMVEEKLFTALQNISFHHPSQWIHSCMAITKSSSQLQILWIVDGITVANRTIETAGRGPTTLKGKIIVGAVYDYWKNYESFLWTSARFYLTNLNLYSSYLPLEKMQRLTKEGKRTCQDVGDIVAWGEAAWKTHGAVEIKSGHKNKICVARDSMILFREQFKTLDQCMQHCDQKVGGRVKSVATREKLDEVYNFLSDKIKDIDENVWMSVTDPEQKGEWQDVYTGEPIDYMNASFPNQKDLASFAVLDAYDFYHLEQYPGDIMKDKVYCLCSVGPVNLRGVCQSSYYSTTPTTPIETEYIRQRSSDSPDVFTYVSDFESVIHYDEVSNADDSENEPTQNYWVISKSSKILLKLEDSHGKSVFGKRNWTVQSKSPFCNKRQNETIELKLTGCPNGYYTCNNGQCIWSKKRCDHIADCRDESDEEDCKILILRKSYRKISPPIMRGNNINVTIPADVKINITLEDVSSIKEAENEIKVKFSMTINWYETRAIYHNLKLDKSQNMLEEDDVSKIWTPNLVFQNSKDKEDTRSGLAKSKLLVLRQGNLSRSEPDIVDEIEIFKGGENPLITTQSIALDCQCNYDFMFFPFDTQVIENDTTRS